MAVGLRAADDDGGTAIVASEKAAVAKELKHDVEDGSNIN